MVVAGILALLYRITPAAVSEGPAGTVTRNYVAEDRRGRRWFVKAYPRGADMEAERQALALGEAARAAGVPVPAVRRTVTGEVIASAGGLSVSVAEYVADAETAEGGLSGGRWDAVGEAVGRLHRALARHPAGPPRPVAAYEVCDVARAGRRLEELLARWAATPPVPEGFAANATTSFALGLLNTLWALHLLRTLAVSETAFGVVLGLGALGAAAGALTAPALARRWDPGPMMLTALAITPLAQIPLLVASPGLRWQITIAVALFLQLACAGAARGLGILPGPVGDGLPEQVVEAMSSRFLAAVPQLGASRPLQILITRHQLGGSQPRPAQERQSHRWSSLRTSPLPPQCQHRAHPALRYHCTSSDLRLVLARFPTTETTMSTMPAKRRELPLEALSGD